jgi:rubrerythrin
MAQAKKPRPYDENQPKVPRDVKVWRCEPCGYVTRRGEPPHCQLCRAHEQPVDPKHPQADVESSDDASPPLP